MKQTILLLLLFLLNGSSIFAQQKAAAEELIQEGIVLHDKGNYEAAIAKYDQSLQLDKDNFYALHEKAMSLMYLQKYKESIELCQKAMEIHPDKNLSVLYVVYGNSYDGLNNNAKALEIYDEGIAKYPDSYELHYNKGIALIGAQEYDKALLSFQTAIIHNPLHASSHNAIGRVQYGKDKRIAALLAYSRFFVLESDSKRAKENFEIVQRIMNGNVEKTGKRSVTININAGMLADTTADGKPNENSFATADLLLSMASAIVLDKKSGKKTPVEQFMKKFETVCSSLAETRKDNYGFYWEYYAPYFTEMMDKKFIETFSYIVFINSGDPDIIKWIKKHKEEIEAFYEWSENYVWSKK